MDRLNLNYLRALLVLLQQRHVTKAAQALHLTQSAMSRQLAALREHFDDPLLIREGQHYLLTAKAEQLQQQVQLILQQIDQLKETSVFEPETCQRQFKFACTDYVAQFLFPEVLARLNDCAEYVDIDYKIWQPKWLKQLGSMPIDMASTMSDKLPENICSLPLGEDDAVCLMAQHHPLASNDVLSNKDLVAYPHVHISSGGDKDSFVDQTLLAEQLKRRVSFRVPFFSAGFSVISQSKNIMILPEHIARNASAIFPVCYRRLKMKVPRHQYFLIWHQIHNHDPAHQWLRELIADVISASIYAPGYDFKS